MWNQIIADIGQAVSEYLIYNVIFSVVILGILFFLVRKKGIMDGRKAASWFFFVIYLCFVAELTLLNREAGSRIGVSLKIWGTYAPDLYAKCWMVENVLLFLPLGLLFPVVIRSMRKTGRLLLVSFCLSLGIELIQLCTKRGYFQVDDIWLNVLGALIGLGVYFLTEIFGVQAVIGGGIFLLLWAVIFGFSAQNGKESGSLSDRIAGWIAQRLYQLFHWQINAQSLAFPVRKTAHMTEYALLWLDTFCTIAAGLRWRKKGQRQHVALARNASHFLLVFRHIAGSFLSHKKGQRQHVALAKNPREDFVISRGVWIVSFFPVFLVAVSDEIHQLFVPGRAGTPIDVGWDMLGAILCMLFIRLLMRLWRHA